MTAAIAEPLVGRVVPAHGLTFTARTPRGGEIRTACPTVAARLALRGWDVAIDSRPERTEATPCAPCGGEHR